MLDAIDRVLGDGATVKNNVSRDPAPIMETVEMILDELRGACVRLEAAATDAVDNEALRFVADARPRIEQLIERKDELARPAAGDIEIELDYAALHEFMLAPDLQRLAS